MASPLSNERLSRFARSILARSTNLVSELNEHRLRIEKTGLVNLNLAIHVFASRYLDRPDISQLCPTSSAFAQHSFWNRVIECYCAYLAELVNVSRLVQRALIDRDLTPRTSARVPVWPQDLDAWVRQDIEADVEAVMVGFWEKPPPAGADAPAWPDYVARAPDYAIDASELSAWRVRTGLDAPLREDEIKTSIDATRDWSEPSGHASTREPVTRDARATEVDSRAPALDPSKGPPASVDQNTLKATIGNAENGKVRNRKMDAPIAQAKQKAADPDDTQSVWDALYKLAASDDRSAPLLGVDAGSIKWLDPDDESQEVQFFTKKNLRDRLYRDRTRAKRTDAKTLQNRALGRDKTR